jgi:hypothetical protein
MSFDARHRTVQHPSTLSLFDALEAPLDGWVRAVMRATDATLTSRGGVTHRALVEPIARAVGLDDVATDRCGAVLDAAQVMVDLVDNLTDVGKDRARGLDPLAPVATIPAAALFCLPSVIAGCMMSGIHRFFPSPLRGGAAAARATTVFGRMVAGQAADDGSEARVDLASGMQGLLLCLPLWLVFDDSAPQRARLVEVERWAFEYARTWELREAADGAPRDPVAAQRHRDACVRARAAWPTGAPFEDGAALSTRELLP